MTRCLLTLNVYDFDPERGDAVVNAALAYWKFVSWDGSDDCMRGIGEDFVDANVTDRQIADELAAAIWQANGAYCRITVAVVRLDDPPAFEFEREDYDSIMDKLYCCHAE